VLRATQSEVVMYERVGYFWTANQTTITEILGPLSQTQPYNILLI
jgi:hypothetical protein